MASESSTERWYDEPGVDPIRLAAAELEAYRTGRNLRQVYLELAGPAEPPMDGLFSALAPRGGEDRV